MQLCKKTGCQLQVTLVVMITQLREGEPPNQRTKAEQYWPDRCALCFTLSYLEIDGKVIFAELPVVELFVFPVVCLMTYRTCHTLAHTQSDEPFLL